MLHKNMKKNPSIIKKFVPVIMVSCFGCYRPYISYIEEGIRPKYFKNVFSL